MGRNAPVRLNEIQGDLVLEIYNYLGQDKPFWEMGWPGAFYQGKPQCGFYLEMAERGAYADGRAFGQAVAAGELHDQAEAPFVYAGDRPRPLAGVLCARRAGTGPGNRSDGMEAAAALDAGRRAGLSDARSAGQAGGAASARQSDSGEICLGEAVLRWGPPGSRVGPGLAVCQPGHRALGGGLYRRQPGAA